MRSVTWLIAIVTTALPALAAAESSDPKRGPGTDRDEDCLVCHAGVGEEDAPKLDVELYAATAHGKEGCVGCHPDVEDASIKHEEADEDLAPAECGACHEQPDIDYRASVHFERHAERLKDPSAEEAATCAGCHGAHDIRPKDDARARINGLHQSETCGKCHGDTRRAAGHPVAATDAAAGEPPALEDDPLVTAACSDCHGAHLVRPADHTESSLYPSRVLETCRSCHEDESAEFRRSAHQAAAEEAGFSWSDALNAADPAAHQNSHDHDHGKSENHAPANDIRRPPVCITCHQMHGDRGTLKSSYFREDLVQECGTCHASLMASYVESYHGKATLLGADSVAKCSDCHGAHAILGPDDGASTVAPENKLEMCESCHEGAPENFAGFYVHPDLTDSERYPVLYWIYTFITILLVSVFTFFGLHTLLWAVREGVDAIRNRGRPAHVFKGKRVRRFSRTDRIIHFFVIISFLGLAATGAPLKFAQASWARFFLGAFGGVEFAGFLHRVFAVITFGYFFAHIIQLASNLLPELKKGRLLKTVLGPDSLVPRLSDITDVINHFGWFLGLAKKPTWERWTYWEKFDYWAVFWGVAIIGSSGLILWFPVFFTQLLPGWAINVALVVHSDEALLAIGFFFGVHFFNSHLRRSKFPMDEVMFTGSMPMEEYIEERGRQYQRGDGEQGLEGLYVPDPHPVFTTWARVFGISAWLFGLVILALIIHGFITTGGH